MWSLPSSDNAWELTLNKFVNSSSVSLQFWSTKLYSLSLCKHECLLVFFRETAKLKSQFKVLEYKFNKNTEKMLQKFFYLLTNIVLSTYNIKIEALSSKALIFHQYAAKISCYKFHNRAFSSTTSWRKEETRVKIGKQS